MVQRRVSWIARALAMLTHPPLALAAQVCVINGDVGQTAILAEIQTTFIFFPWPDNGIHLVSGPNCEDTSSL